MREARLSRVAKEFAKGAAAEASILPYKRGKRVLGCGRICRRLSRKWSAVIGQGRSKASARIIACKTARFPFYREARFFIKNRRAKPENCLPESAFCDLNRRTKPEPKRESAYIFAHHSEIVKKSNEQE
jgi:hypothetical protein